MSPLKSNTGRRTMIHMSKTSITSQTVHCVISNLILGFKLYGENHERYDELKKYFAENPNAKVHTMERKERIEPKDHDAWERKF